MENLNKNLNNMVQLSNLKRVMSKMAMIAIITMLFAGIANAQTVQNTQQAIEQKESCKDKKQQCKQQKKENKQFSKANKQLCKEQCKEKKQQQKQQSI